MVDHYLLITSGTMSEYVLVHCCLCLYVHGIGFDFLVLFFFWFVVVGSIIGSETTMPPDALTHTVSAPELFFHLFFVLVFWFEFDLGRSHHSGLCFTVIEIPVLQYSNCIRI